MTPIEAAVKAGSDAGLIDILGVQMDEEAARAIITAFLEAAAADASTCVRVGDEASARAESSRYESGQDAILALKEAVG